MTLPAILANGCYLAALLPYLSLAPLETDVQLPCVVFGLFTILAIWGSLSKSIRFDLQDFVVAATALLYLTYANSEAWNSTADTLRKTSAMTMGAIVYFAARHGREYLSQSIPTYAAIFHLFAAGLQSFMPDLHGATIGELLGNIRGGADRGIGGACPEASFLANVAILIPIAAWITHGHLKLPKSYWWTLWICSAGMFFFSQAATAAAYGLVVLIVFGLSKGWRSAFITIALSTLLVFVGPSLFKSLPSSRATEVAAVAIDNPRLLIEDPSASMRLIGHYIATPSLRERPLGTGDVQFNADYFWELWNRYDIANWYEIEISRLSGQYYALGFGYTDIGAGTVRMGYFFLICLAAWFLSYLGTKKSWVVVAFVSLGVLSSIPISFPGYWLLLGIIVANRHDSGRESAQKVASPSNAQYPRQSQRGHSREQK